MTSSTPPFSRKVTQAKISQNNIELKKNCPVCGEQNQKHHAIQANRCKKAKSDPLFYSVDKEAKKRAMSKYFPEYSD
jgi:hypothetical protein